MNAQTYIGKRIHFEGYQGNAIKNFTFSVFNQDGTPFDFSNATSFDLVITQWRNLTPDANYNGPVAVFSSAYGQLTNVDNDIIWNATGDDMDFDPRRYYTELTYTETTGGPFTICFGPYKQLRKA